MKKITILSSQLLIAVLVLFSCKKNIYRPGDNDQNPPVDTTTTRTFQFVLETLPGQTTVINNLSAVLTITNEQNEVIVSNRKMALSYSGKYKTDTLILPKGAYKVSKFWVVTPNNTIDFVAPVTGSAKAHLVTKPLALQFDLIQKPHREMEMQVARVNANDKAEDFGYPSGSFGTSNPPDDPNGMIKIRVHPLIRIGEVVYDSIPVTLTLHTWATDGQVTTTTHTLQPGRNDLWLSKAATKYQLKISKWGAYDEMTLLRNGIQEGMLYSLGGSRAANKLSEVLNYQLVNNTFVPQTRDLYRYEAGQIKEILHYRKRADGNNYLAETEQFHYVNGKVASIKRYDENAALIETTLFTYKSDGKVQQMVNTKGTNQILATVDYTPLAGGTGISGNHNISIRYNYNYLTYSEHYVMSIQGGMMVNSSLSSSHGNNEVAHYQYDFSINPFTNLGIPDLFWSNYSKHNKVAEQRTYHGSYPITEPYNFTYSYDANGYPTEVITKYRTYLTGQHSTTIKTVFKY
jgi:hypothetical protein